MAKKPFLPVCMQDSVPGMGCIVGSVVLILSLPDCLEVDRAGEFAAVSERRWQAVSASEAFCFVAGYTCLNDPSARDFQPGDGQRGWAKSEDAFTPFHTLPDLVPNRAHGSSVS